MDPNRRQPQPSGHLQVAPSTPRRSLSPSPSRLSAAPPTPSAVSDIAEDYFDPLTTAASSQSRFSLRSRAPSNSGIPASRPTLDNTRLPSIRLRRNSNASLVSALSSHDQQHDGVSDRNDSFRGRPRSVSQPERAHVPDVPGVARHSRRVPQVALPRLTEEGGRPSMAELGFDPTSPLSPTRSLPEGMSPHDELPAPVGDPSRLQRGRKLSRLFWPKNNRRNSVAQDAPGTQAPNPDDEYAQELVDWLDIIDPEVQTLSTLTNVQNSLFVPDLGNWLNRRPTYTLSQHQPEQEWARGMAAERHREPEPVVPEEPELEQAPPMQRSSTITSRLTESHYAALPHGTDLAGWTVEEKKELDDHVRHMMHSRRSRMKRRFKGFGQYVRRPLGFFVTLYATLITLFGLAWVLFLIGWIYVGEKQVYAIHIIDSILVALFAVMGDGLAPFRAVDTYHMIFIARYSRMINRAEKGKAPRARLRKRSIPEDVRESIDLENYGRLTSQQARDILASTGPCAGENEADENQNVDRTNSKSSRSSNDVPALTYKQLQSLQHHQKKMAKSHSFYKPQETFTHHEFPLSYLIAIVVLLDCHSCLQISLGACTWGIDYHTRPFALTTVILCVSITCNITAGLLISRGDRKTRKKDVWELLNRQELTEDAIKHMEKKKKEEEEEAEKAVLKEKEQENSDGQSGSSSRVQVGKLIKLPS